MVEDEEDGKDELRKWGPKEFAREEGVTNTYEDPGQGSQMSEMEGSTRLVTGFRRLSVFLAFVGFVGGFWFAGSVVETVLQGILLGLLFAAALGIGTLLLGWVVAGFLGDDRL